MDIQKQYYETVANTLITHLQKRNMNGVYVSSKEDACDYILRTIPAGASISWGGSMSLIEANILTSLAQTDNYTLLDRAKVPADQVEDIYRAAFSCDYYLMSSNAITLDGKLVNVDGNSNRIAALAYGPKHVILVVGMNKIAKNEEEARSRVHNIASPQNTIRLNKETPCSKTGVCHDCLSPDCICSNTIITRNSRHPGRITVLLVGEHLGY